MTLKVAGVLEMLNDGKWHTVEEVRRNMKLNKNQIRQISGFLMQYEFVSVDETGKKIRIEEAVRKFLVQEATS